jgi:hypothetical protein
MSSASSSFWGNPFLALSPGSTRGERLIGYIVRQHGRGRSYDQIVTDPYVLELTTAKQRELLLEEPSLLHALVEDYVETLRRPAA